MEDLIKLLIISHAISGGVALVSGTAAVLSKKGNYRHKKFGLVFYYSMLCSIGISLIISLLPNHTNPFLLTIGLFSMYMILVGKRALDFKTDPKATKRDYSVSISMFILSLVMIIWPLTYGTFNYVQLVFGMVGVFLTSRDWLLYRNLLKLKRQWLVLHLSRITGGYVASVTAFLVVNDFFPYSLEWFLPGIIGGLYIAFWNRKLTSVPQKAK